MIRLTLVASTPAPLRGLLDINDTTGSLALRECIANVLTATSRRNRRWERRRGIDGHTDLTTMTRSGESMVRTTAAGLATTTVRGRRHLAKTRWSSIRVLRGFAVADSGVAGDFLELSAERNGFVFGPGIRCSGLGRYEGFFRRGFFTLAVRHGLMLLLGGAVEHAQDRDGVHVVEPGDAVHIEGVGIKGEAVIAIVIAGS
jgi:hypothetical protein